jgi:hypothetical protein
LIAEAPIDAMSYHEIKPHPETRYITFGGRMNPKQIELLKSAINRMPDHAEIILATDKGKTGDMFADSIAKLSDNKTHVFTRDIPLHGKDWNNHLTYIKGIKIRDFGSKELDGKGVSK